MKDNDAIGQALLEYWKGKIGEQLIIKSNIAEDDEIPLAYLFREEKDLPVIEKKALEISKGKTLDVGAATGVHSLILQEKGLDVTSIDISSGAVEVMKQRGVKKPLQANFFSLENEKFDTILMLMNGSGIAGTVDGFTELLEKSANILSEEGQIIMDSSDIRYMFEEEDGSMWIDLNASYYGEVKYKMMYKNYTSEEFNWLFIDYGKLKDIANSLGWKCDLILEGDHYDYLARLYR